jgi:hypothetical protein
MSITTFPRWNDYGSGNRNPHTQKCSTCHRMTYFKDEICSFCRCVVPPHIPTKQVKRYILRIQKGKQYAKRIYKRI